MEQIFIQLALILLVAFLVSFVVRLFRQPMVIGYIFAGIFVAALIGIGVVEIDASQELITIFSELGIAFLLFMVGLHMNPKVIREIGTASLFIGLGQIIFTFGLAFLVSLYVLGLDIVASAYVGIALSFSSTIIILKLLSDKGQIDSLFGKISIGILIIQDLVAVAVLMFISSLSNGASLSDFAIRTFLGGGALIILLFMFGYFVLPKATREIAKSQELLFLFSICWCFVIAALFSYFGFSIEIGALLAGVVLSISPYGTEIGSKIRPLRDFFLIIFFIILGLNIQLSNINLILFDAVILSILALIFKPVILMVLMRFARYTKRTNFLVGTTLAQISEFSLIVLALGVSMGHISGQLLSTLTLTGVITITISSYMIIFSNHFYKAMSRFLFIFEKKDAKFEKKTKKRYDTILFGYNRIGFSILQSLKKIDKSFLVVDFNPDTVNNLTRLRIPCLYGDVYDVDLLSELPLKKIQMAVSTIPDFETNLLLIDEVRRVNKDAIVIVRAHQISEAFDLYSRGASYVLTPHFLGGSYVAKMIADEKVDVKEYKEEKKKHIAMLKSMIERGDDHPSVSKN